MCSLPKAETQSPAPLLGPGSVPTDAERLCLPNFPVFVRWGRGGTRQGRTVGMSSLLCGGCASGLRELITGSAGRGEAARRGEEGEEECGELRGVGWGWSMAARRT